MIKSFTLNNTSDSILSRICLASLIWLLLILGGFSMRAWGEDVTTENVYSPSYVKRTVATDNGSSSLSISKASVVDGNYVCALTNGITFTMDAKDGSGNDVSFTGKNGYMEFSCSRGAHRYVYLSWTIPSNHNLKVTKISIKARNDATLRTSRCVIDGTASGEVGTLINDSKDQLVEGATKAGGYSNNVVIDFYRSSGGLGDGTNYIAAIYITYELSYNANIFGFEAEAESNNESYGTATAVLSIAPKDTLQGGPGVTSKSTSATYTATPKRGCQFLGWYSDDEYEDFVIATNPYSTTLTNSMAGSALTRTLYAKFTNKLNKEITWSQSISNSVRSTVIDLTATATGGQDVYYTASPEGRVSIDNTTKKLTCLTAGEVTITAHSDENATYFASSNNPTKTFTIIEHAITTSPTASAITYEQTLVNSALSGGVANVAGTWAWKYPSSVPGAGTANQVAVFTPSSPIISAYPLECNVSVTVNKANPDVTCTVNANTHYVDDTKIDLQSKWTREGDGAITYSVLSFEESGSNNEDGTTPYVESNHYLHLQKAGTAQVKMAIAEGTNYIARNETINVVINKHNPSFTWNGSAPYYYGSTVANIFTTTGTNDTTVRSDNPSVRVVANTLYVNPSFDNANITLYQAENYYWNEKEQIVTITPVKQNNHVAFDLTSSNRATFGESMSGEAKWEDNGYTYGNGKWGIGDRPEGSTILHFTGIPDTLQFKINCVAWGLNYPVSGDYLFEAYESTDGGDWTKKWACDNSKQYSKSENQDAIIKVALSPTTRYIKLRYKGACWGQVQNIHVGEKYQFVANEGESTFDFGSKGAKFGQQIEKLVFDHANAGSITTAEILSGADAACFTVTPTTISGTGRDKSGTCTLLVSFDNKDDVGRENSDYTATLRISDNRGNVSNVTLKGHRWGLTAPEFTWNQHHMPYYHNATISNVVVSTNTDYANCPFSYETTDSDIAYVDGGTLHIGEKAGSVTITVSQVSGNNYSTHVETFTFTPRTAPALSVPYYVNKSLYESGSVAIADGTTSAWDSDSADDIRLGDGKVVPTSWGTKVFVIAASGAPDKVSFRYKTNSTNTSYGWHRFLDLLGAPIWTIEESVSGTTWDTVWHETSNSDYWKYATVQLSPSTQYIRFTYNGNGYGYFGNIQVTALDGYKFMRTEDGKYLSRGGKYGTQAILDEIGLAVRVTRYTYDNTHDTTLVQFVDSREYLFEEGTELYTDNGDRITNKWQQIRNADTLIVRSALSGKYITLDNDSLKMTDVAEDATKWIPEAASVRYNQVLTKLDARAASAARVDFGTNINTLALVRSQVDLNDFEKTEITIPHLNDRVYEANVSGVGREAAGMWKVYNDTIEGLTPGFYRLTVRALYQTGADPHDWENNQLGVESQIAYVYANEGFYPIKSRYDVSGENADAYSAGTSIKKGDYYYPADAAAAGKAFEKENAYVNDVYVYVSADEGETTGTLIYGIVNPSYVPGQWLAYQDFRLTRIARKEYIFNETTDVDKRWDEDANWNRGDQPDQRHAVIVLTDLIIDREVSAYSMRIEEGATVTITPEGGLTIGAGGVKGASKTNFKLTASRAGANKGKTGYLRVSPYTIQPMPEVTMELCVSAYYNASVSGHQEVGTWQYIGSPMVGGAAAKTVFRACMLYDWSETTGTWKNNLRRLVLQPFAGYASSQYNESGTIVSNTGQLVSNSTVVLPLTYTEESATPGCNVFANSFAAPIDITRLSASDFSEGVEASIHMFNTGSRADIERISETKSFDVNAAGQYLSIPVATASKLGEEFGYPTIIPAMQGFYVNTDRAGSLTLNYERLVWNANLGENPNAPLRVKQKIEEEQPTTGSLMLTMYTTGLSDNVYILESETYNASFENGYDASKKMSGAFNIFTVEEENHLAVDATNSIIGTHVGVRTGEGTAYTMLFTHLNSVEECALLDNETGELIDINEGTEYTFFAAPNSVIADRFEIVARADAPAITTGVDKVENGAKVHKFIKDNQLFILKNGVLYNATGAVVR